MLASFFSAAAVAVCLTVAATTWSPPPAEENTRDDPWWPNESRSREPEGAAEAPATLESTTSEGGAAPEVHHDAIAGDSDPRSNRAKASGGLPPVEPAPPLRKASPAVLRVAIGLGAAAPGTKAERAWLDQLEKNVRASTDPKADLTRLALGSVADRGHCRLGLHDLIIAIDHLPGEDGRAILDAWDCGLDLGLKLHEIEDLESSALLAELWREHDRRIAEGAKVRKRKTLSRKAKTALAVTGAVAVTAIAVGVLLGTTLQQDRVVLNVGP